MRHGGGDHPIIQEAMHMHSIYLTLAITLRVYSGLSWGERCGVPVPILAPRKICLLPRFPRHNHYHVAAIPHANVREGVCASFHQRPPVLNRRILSRTTSPRSGAVRSHIHLQSHTKGHPSRARPMMRSLSPCDKPDVGFGTRTATRV